MDFVKCFSNYTIVKGPESWVNIKLNKRICRESWIAYLFIKKRNNIYINNQKTNFFVNLIKRLVLKGSHQ